MAFPGGVGRGRGRNQASAKTGGLAPARAHGLLLHALTRRITESKYTRAMPGQWPHVLVYVTQLALPSVGSTSLGPPAQAAGPDNSSNSHGLYGVA